MRVELDGAAYAVFNVEGRFYVTQDDCTHGPGSLAEGYVLEEEVECPFHQGRFHIPSGAATEAPCSRAIKVWKPVVRDGQVCIDSANPEPLAADRIAAD